MFRLIYIRGKIMKKISIIVLLVFLISGCVSTKTVQTVQTGDFEMNCEQLKFELTNLGAKFEDAESDSGPTGKNIATGLFFWPGVLVNVNQTSRNIDSINSRIEHINSLYSKKCVGQIE